MLQRTEDWFKVKEGRFSASEASRLLTNGTRPMTDEEMILYKKENPKGRNKTTKCIGKTLETYAFEKAIEQIYGTSEEDRFISFDMQRGIVLESSAFDAFAYKKAEDFIEVNKIGFIEYGEHAGASPDGLVSDNAVLEIKCPKRTNFFKLVANGYDEIEQIYIDQMQFQMMCARREKAYFLGYFQEKGKEFLHEVVVKRDEDRIKFIKERLDYAIERKQFYIKQITNNLQTI